MTGYRIQSSSRRTGGWQDLEDDTGDTRTTYQDTGLQPNTTRYYRVAALSGTRTSDWSNVADATTDDITPPGAPTRLTVEPSRSRGSDELVLEWVAPVDDGGSAITGYLIEWSRTGVGGWLSLVNDTKSPATSYTDSGLGPNTTRFYRVSAINITRLPGRSSNVARGTTNAEPPGPPQNLDARGTGANSILLTWDAPETDGGAPVTGYAVQRKIEPDGAWIEIERNTGSTATTFTDTGLQPATSYGYQVAAINREGTGDWSFKRSTTTYAAKPGAPVGLTARAVGTSRIDLSWIAPRNTGGVEILGYRIEASDDRGSTWRIVRRNTNSRGTTFSDVNLQPATTRHYRVAAINTAGTGPFSNTARATTEATVPGSPRSLDANADGTSRIELSWREPTTDGGSRITGYRIEVSEDGGARWENLVANSHNTRTDLRAHGAGAGHEAPLPRLGDQPDRRQPGVAGGERHYRRDRARRAHRADGHRGHVHADRPVLARARLRRRRPRDRLPHRGLGERHRVDGSEDQHPVQGHHVPHTGLMPGSTRHYRVSAINRVGVGAASDTASAATDDPVGRAGRLNTRVFCRTWRPR